MLRALLIFALLLSSIGCTPQLSLYAPGSSPAGSTSYSRGNVYSHGTGHTRGVTGPPAAAGDMQALPGLKVETRDGGTVLFAENGWRLTLDGITGNALVTDADGTQFAADTTLSYLDASSAASTGRDNTMSKFMLTILGVILVLGLAAIILYAAFLATAR